MSTAEFPTKTVYFPPVADSQPLSEWLAEAIGEVSEAIAPVWPLQDYVAVNPYAGMAHRSFVDARTFMRVFSDCETLMPLAYYAAEFQHGRLSVESIEAARAELAAAGVAKTLTVEQIVASLQTVESPRSSAAARSNSTTTSPAANPPRSMRTIAEHVSGPQEFNWSEAIVDEISKYCAAHYDQGQAMWASPLKHLPLYQAWRTAAQLDCNIEILGLNGFRAFVSRLPLTPTAAIAMLLQKLEVPLKLWSTYLLCQAFSIPGWSAWTKYQTDWTNEDGSASNDLVGLLAIRLAYDAALAESQSLRINWGSFVSYDSISSKSLAEKGTDPSDDSLVRYILLRTSEIGYRDQLLGSLSAVSASVSAGGSSAQSEQVDRKLAQMVFCIDVRSERMRRQLETQSSDIDTFGFAGFFGMAFEYVKLGQSSSTAQLPVLLKPQFKLMEGMTHHTHPMDLASESLATSQLQQRRSWLSLWRDFQASAISCFSFVETMGLLYGWKLLKRGLGLQSLVAGAEGGDSVAGVDHLGPTLRGLNQQGITTSRQVDMAEGMLTNLGLTKDFARLVVLCGHACQTENNPLAAGLDCGACGGHSGEPNARFAALLLNQPYIRRALEDRGIHIPKDTHFLGAVHNTTTDVITFFDLDEVPSEQQASVQKLIRSCATASQHTQLERLPVVASKSLVDLLRRAGDWSEVRPEWGLAGNAAFIVAPRRLTKNANLAARSFLHSYDYTQDTAGKVLETIMTAPMIVANWINMQYYASTVDPQYFGSGNKTVHNVVGRFGVLSGNGGDLMTGLPWQSLHTGEAYQHLPLRLQVVIAAPRAMIERVIAKHQLVANLLCGSWLHLIAIEDDVSYRYSPIGHWEKIAVPQLGTTQFETAQSDTAQSDTAQLDTAQLDTAQLDTAQSNSQKGVT